MHTEPNKGHSQLVHGASFKPELQFIASSNLQASVVRGRSLLTSTMDEKIKRECKTYVEKTFKKFEQFGSGSMPKDDVKKLLKIIIPEYDLKENDMELNELLQNYVKASKYTNYNKMTRKMEVQYLENTVDFPSVLAIVVHFIKKIEMKEVNFFSGQQVVKVKDFPHTDQKLRPGSDQKKKMF